MTMSKTIEQHAKSGTARFILMDGGVALTQQLGKQNTFVVTRTIDLNKAFEYSSTSSVWVMAHSNWANRLVSAMSERSIHQRRRPTILGDLVMLAPSPRNELIPSLHHLFRRVVGAVPSFTMLPRDQLGAVLSSDNRSDLFIGGIVDESSKTITLARGDLDLVTVPFSIFRSHGTPKPDFKKFELDDYGYAVRFGDYEATAHSILFDIDPNYRKKINRQRIAEERGFGPSLRRLRIARGLSRSSFPGIASKTIARLERAESTKPQGKTLNTLTKVLKVTPEEIETY